MTTNTLPCIAMNRRNPNRIGKRGGEVDALALPLAMSIAAFVAQVVCFDNSFVFNLVFLL